MGMSVDGGTFTSSIHSVDKLFSEIKISDFLTITMCLFSSPAKEYFPNSCVIFVQYEH
jgi:hypothetical protein